MGKTAHVALSDSQPSSGSQPRSVCVDRWLTLVWLHYPGGRPDAIPANMHRRKIDAEIEGERTTHDLVRRQGSPKTAVVGVGAIVAHHEQLARRHDDRSPIQHRR